jgi:chromosome segregation ATPase
MIEESGHRIDRPHTSGQRVTAEAAADFAEERQGFMTAVEAELRRWDSYLERLQVKAATAGRARERAEEAISDLRRHRTSLAVRLGALQSTSAGAWSEARAAVDAARKDLALRAAELAAGLERVGKP